MASKLCTPVLLTYSWVRSTYAALRCLDRKGITVYTCDSNALGMCQQSRYTERFYRYRDPFSCTEDGFIEDLNRIASKKGPLVLIPSHDETEVLARRMLDLSPQIICPINNYNSISLANDKYKMATCALEAGVPVPEVVNYNSLEELAFLLDKSGKQFVVKLRKGNSAKGVFYPSNDGAVVDMVDQLIRKYELLPDRYPIVQRRVEGTGWGVSCLYWEGKRIAHFTHQRLREKTHTGGTSTLRESKPNPLLEQMAFALLDSLKWHGLAMVEFKYCEESKKGWFIEVNPRMWGSIGLAVSSGIEFPYLLYLCATEGPAKALSEAQAAKLKFPWRARWYLGDLIIAISMLGSVKTIPEAVKYALPGGADIMDDLYLDDLGAFAGEVANYAYRFIKYRSLNPVEGGMIG